MKAKANDPTGKRTTGERELAGKQGRRHSLKDLQTFMWQAISSPLTGNFEMRKGWIDGRDLNEIAEEYVCANHSLSSFERLEIYNQQYWFRLLDCFDDDFPGLKSLLGARRFAKLAKEYLIAHPSSSYSLRDLGECLTAFLEKRIELIEPEVELCLEMARLEWARIVAFDGSVEKTIDQQYIKTSVPDKMTLALQPYISLLELNHALDDFTIAFNRHHRDRSEAGSGKPNGKRQKIKALWPVREKVYMVVHRLENTVYLKRVELPAFVILSAIKRGQTLNDSVMEAVSRLEEENIVNQNLPDDIQNWFALWMRLGWLCLP